MTTAATEPVTEPAGTKRVRPLRDVGQFVHNRVSQLQTGYLERRPSAVAALAQLRRGIGKPVGSVAELWQLTLEGVPLPALVGDEPTVAERAAHTALTLYAVHQQSRGQGMHRRGQGLGTAARLLSQRGPSADAARRRFEALGTATTFEETTHHARGLISQFRAFDIALDYGELADHLAALQNPARADRVRLIWGRDFYRTSSSEQTDPAAERTATSYPPEVAS